MTTPNYWKGRDNMTEMTEEQRVVYWSAVNGLRQLVEEGVDRDELIEEVDDDL